MVRAIEVTAWAVVCVGLWLLTLSAVSLEDLYLAIPAGLICGLLAASGRRLSGGAWHPRTRWLAWLATLPVTVIADTVAVWRAAARAAFHSGNGGHEKSLRLPLDEPDDVAATRRAVVTLVLSASPGSYVVDFDPDHSELLIHTLADSGPSWARLDPGR